MIKDIKQLFIQGESLEDISEKFNYSRQGIKLMLLKEMGNKEYRKQLSKNREMRKKAGLTPFTCKYCRKKKMSKLRRIFCSNDCRMKWIKENKDTPEIIKEKKRKYALDYYYKKAKLS